MTLTIGPFRRRASSGSPTLSTGAIVGLAIGVAVLFLVATSLFVVYWRRMKRPAVEGLWLPGLGPDDYQDPVADGTPTRDLAYTMDHKSPPLDKTIHSPQAASPTTVQSWPSSHAWNESLQHTSSALPTHPAYVPRAIVRHSINLRAVPSGRVSSSAALYAGAVPQALYPEPPQQAVRSTIQSFQPSAAAAVEPTICNLSIPISLAKSHDRDRLASVPEADVAVGRPISDERPQTQQLPRTLPSLVHSLSLRPLLYPKRKHKKRSDARARRRCDEAEAENRDGDGLFG